MDVFIVTRLTDPPLAQLHYPTVAECREKIARCNDGSEPLEPYQLVSQNKLEPLLKEVAERTPNLTVRYGCELTDVEQDESGVTASFMRTELAARLEAPISSDATVARARSGSVSGSNWKDREAYERRAKSSSDRSSSTTAFQSERDVTTTSPTIRVAPSSFKAIVKNLR